MGCGKKVAGRRAQDRRRVFGDVLSNQPRAAPFRDQSWLLALGSPVGLVIGFAQPVVEGRGENYSSQQEMPGFGLLHV